MMRPEVLEGLQAIGRATLAGTVEDWFGESPYSVAAFSDYAGDARDAQYEVFATYLLHLNTARPLLDRLDAIKESHGIAERTVDYKGRKDRRKGAALNEYVDCFASHPGICVAICWDKRIFSFRRRVSDRQAMRTEIAARLNAQVKFETAERLVKALGFLPVVGHGLRDGDRLVWISDHDAINEGACGAQISTTLAAVARQVIRAKLAQFGFSKPLDPTHETLLTLPDLVAGTLAAALPAPLPRGHYIATRDPTTNTLFGYLAQLNQGTRLIVIVVEADPLTETTVTREILLAPWQPIATAGSSDEPFRAAETIARMGSYTFLGSGPGMSRWRRR